MRPELFVSCHPFGLGLPQKYCSFLTRTMAVRWSFALSLAVSVVQGYVQYPTFSFVNSQRCLDRDSLIFRSKFQLYANFPNYSLRYPENTVHPVSLPYPLWASGRITGEIAFILISEVMQYWAHMFNTATDYSAQVVNYASGCLDLDDPNCVLRDTTRPKYILRSRVGNMG